VDDICEICGKRAEYTCRYCGGRFCSEHISPVDHDCPVFWNVPVRVKRKRVPSINLSKILSYGANNIVVGICTILFLISILERLLTGRDIPENIIRFLALDPIYFIVMPWQLVTSMFLHVDFWHYFVNMFVLFFFGTELERRVGSIKYLKIFLLSGLAGNLAYILYAYALNQFAPALGASAAIFGVMGCLAIIAPEIRVFIFPFPIPISIRMALILFALYDLVLLPFSYKTGVAHVAHLAGLLSGIYYGRRLRWRRYYY